MSDDTARAGDDEKEEPERRAEGRDYAVCLHCNNPFLISEGVVTSEAALCDVCNGSD